MGESRLHYIWTRFGGPAAKTRAFWHFIVRRYRYEICFDCGRPVGMVWSAPPGIWERINGQRGGILCARCFDKRYEESDEPSFLFWRCVPDPVTPRRREQEGEAHFHDGPSGRLGCPACPPAGSVPDSIQPKRCPRETP